MRTAGHSGAMTLYHAVSRQPSGIFMSRRWIPSNCAGSASMAARERALRASVLSSTRSQSSVSKAWAKSSSLVSTFAPVRHQDLPIQVQPISSPALGPQGQVSGAADRRAAAALDDRPAALRAFLGGGEGLLHPAMKTRPVLAGVGEGRQVPPHVQVLAAANRPSSCVLASGSTITISPSMRSVRRGHLLMSARMTAEAEAAEDVG